MTVLRKSVSLNPGQSKEVAFQFTPSQAKAYSVLVNGLAGSFSASEALPKLASVYGVVTFRKTGAPLGGVKISVDGITTYTNASGEYLIENVTPGNYLMTLEKEGYELLWDWVTILAGANEINAEMTLVPALMASLHGYVTDVETGAAIFGAEITVVELTDFMEANVYKTTIGTNGFYSLENMLFENSPIVVDISVEAAGYDLIKLKDVGLAEGDNELNFKMTVPPPKFANFRGLVLDAPTNAPLEGVLVNMNGLTAYTGTDGWFEFTDVIAKRYTIELSREGYEAKSFEYTLREGDIEYPVPIKMTRIEAYAARLYGYVTDNETGKPVLGADITVYQDYDMETATYRYLTAEDGYYELRDMIPGVKADMVIYAGGYTTYTRTGILINEGDNVRNIVLTWAGGPRDVPRFISYNITPSPMVSGGEFTGRMQVWLPYRAGYLISCRLVIRNVSDSKFDTELYWGYLPANIWDRLKQSRKEEYIPFATAGNFSMEAVGVAMYKYKWGVVWKSGPFPPGTYNVIYHLSRTKVTLTGANLDDLEYWADDWYASNVVGTIQVI